MKSKSTFKYVFWGLLVVIVLLVLVVGRIIMENDGGTGRQNVMVMMLPLFLLLTAYFVIVGRFVYRDAPKRGMDPWLWMTVAVFVPNLVGLIIYLVVRHSVKNVCVNCGKEIEKDFKACPYCGQKQELVCENCQKAVARDWSVCPYCAHPLSGEKVQGK